MRVKFVPTKILYLEFKITYLITSFSPVLAYFEEFPIDTVDKRSEFTGEEMTNEMPREITDLRRKVQSNYNVHCVIIIIITSNIIIIL